MNDINLQSGNQVFAKSIGQLYLSKEKLKPFKRKPLNMDEYRATGILASVAQSEGSNEEVPEAKAKYDEVENALPQEEF